MCASGSFYDMQIFQNKDEFYMMQIDQLSFSVSIDYFSPLHEKFTGI